MSLEQAIQNLADAINSLGSTYPLTGPDNKNVVTPSSEHSKPRSRAKPQVDTLKEAEVVAPPEVKPLEKSIAPPADDFGSDDDFGDTPKEFTEEDVRAAIRWVHKISCVNEVEGKAKALALLKSAGSEKASIADVPASRRHEVIAAALALGYKVA